MIRCATARLRRATDDVEDLERRAEAVHRLAALTRAGLSVRLALERWPEEVTDPSLHGPLARCARRISLGGSVTGTVAALRELGADADTLASVLTLAARFGADAGTLLDEVAKGIARRREMLAAAGASAAGVKLSARLIAGLPLLFVPLAPLARAPLLDGLGAVLLVSGLLLEVAGVACIERLVPRVGEDDDSGAAFGDQLAALLRSGIGVTAALDLAARNPPRSARAGLERARRLVVLGSSWPEALTRSGDEGLTALARVLQRARRAGVPVADALVEMAAARRATQARAFEAAARRAPILMVIPLVGLVLPAFLLLGLAPFLRSLSFAP